MNDLAEIVRKTAGVSGFYFDGYTVTYSMMGRMIFYISVNDDRLAMHDNRREYRGREYNLRNINQTIDHVLKRTNTHCAHSVYEYDDVTYLMSPEGMIDINEFGDMTLYWKGDSIKYRIGNSIWQSYNYREAMNRMRVARGVRSTVANYLINIIKDHPDFRAEIDAIYLRIGGTIDDQGLAVINILQNGQVKYDDLFASGPHKNDMESSVEYLRRLMLAISTPLVHSKKFIAYLGDEQAIAYPQLIFIDGRIVPHGGFYEHSEELLIYTFDDFCERFGAV
jgi:hypothetical protein